LVESEVLMPIQRIYRFRTESWWGLAAAPSSPARFAPARGRYRNL
jgi:hypothetical protein